MANYRGNRNLFKAHLYTTNSLQEVNASVKAKTGQLLNEKAGLFSKTNRMMDERDQLIEERDKLKKERKLLRTEGNDLEMEINHLKKDGQTQDSAVEVNS